MFIRSPDDVWRNRLNRWPPPRPARLPSAPPWSSSCVRPGPPTGLGCRAGNKAPSLGSVMLLARRMGLLLTRPVVKEPAREGFVCVVSGRGRDGHVREPREGASSGRGLPLPLRTSDTGGRGGVCAGVRVALWCGTITECRTQYTRGQKRAPPAGLLVASPLRIALERAALARAPGFAWRVSNSSKSLQSLAQAPAHLASRTPRSRAPLAASGTRQRRAMTAKEGARRSPVSVMMSKGANLTECGSCQQDVEGADESHHQAKNPVLVRLSRARGDLVCFAATLRGAWLAHNGAFRGDALREPRSGDRAVALLIFHVSSLSGLCVSASTTTDCRTSCTSCTRTATAMTGAKQKSPLPSRRAGEETTAALDYRHARRRHQGSIASGPGRGARQQLRSRTRQRKGQTAAVRA